MGNICRSPTAEGMFRKLAADKGIENRFEVDSAGTGGWHIGSPPDERAQRASLERGIDISSLQARQVVAEDIVYYDTIIAMDQDNLSRLQSMAPESHRHKIRLMLDFGDGPKSREVPDPYYGGEHGFDLVLDLLEDACEKLIIRLLGRG